jgi:hypothetical protein
VTKQAAPGFSRKRWGIRTIRLLASALLCFLFTGHLLLAAANPCNGLSIDQCAMISGETGVSGDTGDGDGPVPAKQDHASPCQDHCKTIMLDIDGMTRSPDRQFSLLAEVDPAPIDPGAVSPPPQ